ncbi:membrane protein [Mesotoga sp. SC_4PWA21]|nr:membrane protein [Mesotoga sp. SC_4PWA21]
MNLKPTRRSFMIRYFIYPYYFFLGIIFYLNFDLSGIDGNNRLFLIAVWIALTVVPGILLAFSRRRFGWFFWPALLNAAGWLIRYVFPEKTYNDLKPLFDNGPVLLFTVAGLLGVIFVEIYRKSFKYEFSDAGVEITHGMFSANSHMIVARHITNVMLKRNFFELIMGVGHVIPVTSSGMGSGDRGVMGGFTTDAGTQSLRGGAFVGSVSTEKEFVANPANCIYGISKPKVVMEKLKEMVL